MGQSFTTLLTATMTLIYEFLTTKLKADCTISLIATMAPVVKCF